MILTILLSLGMMALLFLAIWSATLTLPFKALIKSFPKDVQEKLSPRLDHLPMSGKRVFGVVILILLVAAMLGLVVWGGIDGMRHDYNFGNFLLRFLVIFAGVKAFDIIVLDYFLLTKSRFFQHYFPETEGCAGWKDFGFNRKEQLKQGIAIPICCSALAGLFSIIG